MHANPSLCRLEILKSGTLEKVIVRDGMPQYAANHHGLNCLIAAKLITREINTCYFGKVSM